MSRRDELTFFEGRGNHSVNQLEDLMAEREEYIYQRQLEMQAIQIEHQRVVGEKDELLQKERNRAKDLESELAISIAKLSAAEKVIEFYAEETNWSPAYKGSIDFLNAVKKEDMEPFGGGEFCGGKKAREYLQKHGVKNG